MNTNEARQDRQPCRAPAGACYYRFREEDGRITCGAAADMKTVNGMLARSCQYRGDVFFRECEDAHPEETSMEAPHVLQRAEHLIRQRGMEYDGASADARERSMARAVSVFNELHDTGLTVAQGWSFMLILKLVRAFGAPKFHQDSVDDATAYVALMAESMAMDCSLPTTPPSERSD